MRRLLLIAAVAATGFTGCGGAAHHPQQHRLTFPQPTGAPCHPRNPPALGECVRQHFGITKPTRPTLTRPGAHGTLCEDWSQWQGSFPSTGGLACVIIQSNYGLHVEPTVWSQVRDAHEHGVACGLYTFGEGNAGSAEARLAVSIYHRTPCTLGVTFDAEIGAAYSHACAYTAEARRLGVLALLYTAPGLWPGGRCDGYLWPAEWGVSGPYPFGGYPTSAIKLWQFCGTCGVDLDRDRGLIAIGHPESPAERHAKKVKRLHALYRARERDRADIRALHRVLASHHCFVARHHRPKGGRCAKWKHRGDQAHRSGARHNREINQLHREGIF